MADGSKVLIGGRGADHFLAAYKALRSDPAYQFDFDGPAPAAPLPLWLRWLGRVLIWVGPYLQYVFWGALVLGGGLVLALIVREFVRYRRPARAGKPAVLAGAEAWTPNAARARVLLADADRLAAEGRFEAAAHLLLKRSIDEIEDRNPRLIARSYTARDIAELDGMPEPARKAFHQIARWVEISLFGQRPLGAEAWAECRRAYEDLVFPEAWREAT